MIFALIFCFGLLLGVIIGVMSERKNHEKKIILGSYYLNSEDNTIVICVEEEKVIDGRSDIVLKRVSHQ